MKKLGSFIKNNVIGFILGAIIFGSVGAVVAGTVASSAITYTNNNQSNVQGALNELYIRANTWINPNDMGTPQYYTFGTYKVVCSDYDTMCDSLQAFPTTSTTPPSGKNVYAAKYVDDQYGICIKRNGTQHCFRARNWIVESKHLQMVFSDISCDVTENTVQCNASDFECNVYSDGTSRCNDRSGRSNCIADSTGIVECR